MAFFQSLFSGQNPALTLVWVFLGLAALLIASFWLFRKIAGARALKPTRNRAPRLAVTDAAIVDDKRRLVLVRRDNVEHLVMIGGPVDIVIEQNIQRAQAAIAPREAAPVYREVAQTSETPPAARPSNGELAAAKSRPRAATGRARTGQEADLDEPEAMAAEAEPQPAEPPAPARETVTSMLANARRGRAELPPQQVTQPAAEQARPLPAQRTMPETAVQSAPAIAAQTAAIAPDFEFDLASELQREVGAKPSPAVQAQAAPSAGSFEDELSAEMAQEFDLPKQINDNSQGTYAAFPGAANQRTRPGDDVDDEMQRLLKELANA